MSDNKGGRPPLHAQPMTRVTVHLTPEQMHWAYVEGSRNVSVGLRKLLDELEAVRRWHHDRLGQAASAEAPVARSKHQ